MPLQLRYGRGGSSEGLSVCLSIHSRPTACPPHACSDLLTANCGVSVCAAGWVTGGGGENSKNLLSVGELRGERSPGQQGGRGRRLL